MGYLTHFTIVGFRQGCVEHLVNHRELLLVCILDNQSCQSVPKSTTKHHVLKPSEEPSLNFLVDKRWLANLTYIISIIFFYLFYVQIVVSKKWGFTKYDKEDYTEMRQNGRLIPCGAHAKYIAEHGPLAEWERMQLQ